MLIATTLIVTFSVASGTSTLQPANTATSSVQTINVADPQTQFKLDVAYAYIGPAPLNSSYIANNGANMSIVSQYPSVVELNITRLPGVQIPSCDAVLEIYNVQITTNTGLVENNPYFVGTNYSPSFSSSELSTLFAHADDLTPPQNFSTPLRGNFEFNMTECINLEHTPRLCRLLLNRHKQHWVMDRWKTKRYFSYYPENWLYHYKQ